MTEERKIRPRTVALIFAGLVATVFLSVVAARTEAVAIVKTGDRGPSLASLALLQSGGGKPLGVGGGGENVAVAINTKDGTTVFESAFLITYAASGVVDQENAAIAYSSCELCRSFAAAIQVVLVPEDRAKDITPTNTSIAINEECLGCETVSFATQIILGVSGPVRLTEEGNEMMEEIWADLEEISEEAGDLTVEEITARYDDIVARLEDILENELAPVGGRPENPGGRESTVEGALEETAPETTEPTVAEETSPQEATEPTTGERTSPEATVPEETEPVEAAEPTTPDETTAAAPETTLPEETVSSGGAPPEGTAAEGSGEPPSVPYEETPVEATTAP